MRLVKSIERRPFPLWSGFTRVVRAAPVTPMMRRVTLAAPQFADFGVEEPGEIVTLGWADPGAELVLPQLGWRFPPGKREQHWRNFTVRAHRPRLAEIDVDFFLHGDGRASAWAAAAEPGDGVGFAGPRVHWEQTGGVDWSLLVADETGLPALLAILETLPAGHPAVAVVEVGSEEERQPIRTQADAELHWLSARGRLVDTVRELTLPWGRGHVWGGGESQAMRAIRDELRRRSSVTTVQALGYWSRQRR
jgi:NADPH-dependent ferric siderophore reductase